jgi:hypothetical protein
VVIVTRYSIAGRLLAAALVDRLGLAVDVPTSLAAPDPVITRSVPGPLARGATRHSPGSLAGALVSRIATVIRARNDPHQGETSCNREANMAAQMIGGEIVLSYDARQFDELTAADVVDRPNWQTKVSTSMAKTFLRRAYDELVGMSGIS